MDSHFGCRAHVVCLCGGEWSYLFCRLRVEESNARIPPIPSPDRRHVAVIRWWLPGALGHDMVHVSIRKPHSPFASEVLYATGEPPEAAGGEPDPKVEWIDSRTLVIIYSEKGSLEPCSPTAKPVDGIQVLCRD
jgi:hypothetical protein